MRRLIPVLCIILFGFTGRASAQLSNCFTPNYSSYRSYTFDTSSVTQTVTVSGSTTINQACMTMMTSAHHWVNVTNQVGSYGGVTASPSVCPWCYLSYSTSVTAPNISAGVQVQTSEEEVYWCSQAGRFGGGGGGSLNVKIAISNYILKYYDASNCYYSLFCPNGNAAASCPTPNFIAYGGVKPPISCQKNTYAFVYKLWVNGKCSDVGISVLSPVPKNCQ
jgi:hypothetical protein